MATKNRFLKTREVLKETGITHQILYRYITMGLVQETHAPAIKARSHGEGRLKNRQVDPPGAGKSTRLSGRAPELQAGSAPGRSSTHAHRRYPPETIAVIKLIQMLNQSGYTLRDIKDIFFKENRLDDLRKRWGQP